MEQTRTAGAITGIGRVIVPVADHDRAIDFYVGTMGFEKTADVPFDEGRQRWVEVALPGTATGIAFGPPQEGAGFQLGRETGIVLDSDDVERDHAELKARGVDVDEGFMQPEGGPKLFGFRDVDGNGLMVVQAEQE